MAQSLGKRILLIGWDAADWEMIDPLLQSGQMPALARLIKGGLRGNLATLAPVLSPMLWTNTAFAASRSLCLMPSASGLFAALPENARPFGTSLAKAA